MTTTTAVDVTTASAKSATRKKTRSVARKAGTRKATRARRAVVAAVVANVNHASAVLVKNVKRSSYSVKCSHELNKIRKEKC